MGIKCIYWQAYTLNPLHRGRPTQFHQLTDHGRSTSKRSFGSGVEVINGNGTHEGHLQMGVGVDAPGDDQFTLGFDDLGTPWCDEVLPHLSAIERWKVTI